MIKLIHIAFAVATFAWSGAYAGEPRDAGNLPRVEPRLFVRPLRSTGGNTGSEKVHAIVQVHNAGAESVVLYPDLNFSATVLNGKAPVLDQKMRRGPMPSSRPGDRATWRAVWLGLERTSDAMAFLDSYSPVSTSPAVSPVEAGVVMVPGAVAYLEYELDAACIAGTRGRLALSAFAGNARVGSETADLEVVRAAAGTSADARPAIRQR